MSINILQFDFPDAINAPDLQVWNNAAFEEGGEQPHISPAAWWAHESLDSNASKENLSPVMENSPASAIPLKPVLKPLHAQNGVVSRAISKNGVVGGGDKDEEQEDCKIDKEIEEIEKEIARLSSRLHALKLEKVERKIKKTVEKRGRIVPAKFMDHRGLSLGPVEIMSGSKSRLLGKQENGVLTPASKQSRRVSCFWRLQEIDELKVIKERGKSASLSPKSRKGEPKTGGGGPAKQAVTTGGSKRPGKKDDGLIQPRVLFKDGDKEKEKEKLLWASNKKVGKPGRVVASRYNLGSSEVRKRSLPDNENEEGNKRRVSRGGGGASNGVGQRNNGGRVKKWDVGLPNEGSFTPLVATADVLPKIRTSRVVNETPRDSGPAKRVADLVGRKSFFCAEEGNGDAEAGHSVCQVLSFTEEDAYEGK